MAKESPFPGMDPFLENVWQGVHTRLLGLMSSQIAEQLPDDLYLDIEQAISLGEGEEQRRAFSDVDISEWGDVSNWEADWNPAYTDSSHWAENDDGTPHITEPKVLIDPKPPHRHLKIHSIESGNPLITVIELLSPANKGNGRDAFDYIEKRKRYLSSLANFVEIDLIRKGGRPLGDVPDVENIPPYLITVSRVGVPLETYPIEYEDSLPCFRIPLRPRDIPAILDLQKAVDDCYREGQYWKRINYQTGTLSPRADEALQNWITETVG